MRFFDEEVREEQREKWIPEKMPRGFGADREGGGSVEVVEQKQDDTRVVSAAQGGCTVTPFLQDFLTRRS